MSISLVQPKLVNGSLEAALGGQPAIHFKQARIDALDGVRGLAVLMVLIFHYHQGMLPLPQTWLSKPLRLLDACQTGVDLFFVLSGFLITGILLRAKGTAGFLRNFYMRRALRILPLYYLVVIGCLLVGWVGLNPAYRFEKTWWYLFYLQNVGTTFWPGLVGQPGHFWSLGVEEHFYLIWPFLILACQERRLPMVLLSLVAGAMACRLALLSLGCDVFTFSLCRMDALALGALLATLLRRGETAGATGTFCRRGLVIFAPLLIVLYALTSGAALFGMQAAKYTLVALGYALLIGSLTGPGKVAWIEKAFGSAALRWCGKYSYAMYVFHPFIFYLVMSATRSTPALAQGRAAQFMVCEFGLCVAGTLLVGWLSWHICEKHFLELKKCFEYRLRES